MLAVVIGCVVLFGAGCSPAPMTKDQVMRIFDEAGGIDKVNQESKSLFDLYGTQKQGC